MINSTKLLKISNLLTGLLIVTIFGCGEKSDSKEFIARVNDSYLTNDDLAEMDSLYEKGFSRTELIKRWVDKELLFQEAVKMNIDKQEEYNRIIDNSRRELASSMALNYYLDERIAKPSTAELEEFYESHKNEFKLENNFYTFNRATFNNELAAIKFRTKLLETDWEDATDYYSKDSSLVEFRKNIGLFKNEIYPIQLLNIIQVLYPGEISIVIEENPAKFSVVQSLQYFLNGSNAPFDVMRNKIEARFLASKREQYIAEFLQQLHSKNEIEIREN